MSGRMLNNKNFYTDMKYPNFKVSVSCMTYNHAKFITDAMNGFTMQQTSFPFVCIIVDDASTDGEQEVIRKYVDEYFDQSEHSVAYQKETAYAHITYAQHKTNKNCYFAVLYLKENHYSNPEKYKGKKDEYIKEWKDGVEFIAVCEGDDFWIDKCKIQKQVDFLENNLTYSVCSHRIKKYDQDFNVYYVDRLAPLFKDRAGVEYDNKTKVWLSETSSILFRRSCHEEFVNYPFDKRDSIHLYFLLKHSKGFCLSDVMSIYRQHKGGIYSKQDLDTRLINGGYAALKRLYYYERTADARFLYYRSYALAFLLTRGRILYKERFEVIKFLSLPYFVLSIISGIHPVYKKED